MYRVLVIDTNKRPLMPTHPARARQLLRDKKAAIYLKYPFTIILKREINELDAVQPIELKIDPGSKTTGLALVDVNKSKVLLGINLIHRSNNIKDSLDSRRNCRRRRRSNLRYRKPRFDNRSSSKRKDRFPPSVLSRVDNIKNMYLKLSKYIPINNIVIEDVRFDLQKIENNEISGKEYQQGELYQFEIREYLLEKFDRTCVYCNAKNIPLQVEHVIPKSKGGTNRLSNLVISCIKCNQSKSNLDLKDFLKNKSTLLNNILSQLKKPLKDAGLTNITRNKIPNELEKLTGFEIERFSGSITKYNRVNMGYGKDHWIDAAQVGYPTKIYDTEFLEIKAMGRGNRQMCLMDKYGFPRTGPKQCKTFKGFQTGDIVEAIVTKGKKIGKYLGKIAIRNTGNFNINTSNGILQGISFKYCKIKQRNDGYLYSFKLFSFDFSPRRRVLINNLEGINIG
ncbi:MAG: RNA-guided endonuclease IscB [Magnetococcus sp. YQC-3]